MIVEKACLGGELCLADCKWIKYMIGEFQYWYSLYVCHLSA